MRFVFGVFISCRCLPCRRLSVGGSSRNNVPARFISGIVRVGDVPVNPVTVHGVVPCGEVI